MQVHSKDYLYSVKLNSIDNQQLASYSLEAEKLLKKILEPLKDTKWYGTFTTASHKKYNFLSLPNKQVSILYHEIVKNVTPLLDDRSYVIKSWLNVFRKGEKIEWHKHWHPNKKVWHGFYCVQVGDSYTEYEIPNINHTVKIKSDEGLLVIGKSDNDRHRSSIWTEEDRHRITIAFDIVPIENVTDPLEINHFIPFKL